ncbi:aldehyde dehydrogenase family protein, partial [Pandoraea sputorum]|uniref:aldehyde dehydrogenase family protein n=1 Tax=Pandoraea sputorum TaxID=93222 RepID=UPI003556C99B
KTCMPTEGVIVVARIADALVEKLTAKAAKLHAGSPTSPDSVLAAMVSAQAAPRVAALVEDAREHGARLPLGCRGDG